MEVQKLLSIFFYKDQMTVSVFHPLTHFKCYHHFHEMSIFREGILSSPSCGVVPRECKSMNFSKAIRSSILLFLYGLYTTFQIHLCFLHVAGAPMVAQMSSSAMSNRVAIEAHAEGPTSTCQDQGDLQGGLEPDQPDDHPGHSGYREESSSQPDQPQHSHPSQYMDCSADGPDQTEESSSSFLECSGEEPDQTRSQTGFPDYSGNNSDQDLPGYVECSGADSNPTSRSHYIVDCSSGYLQRVADDREQLHHSRSYIDSSADHRTQTSRQYAGESGGECIAAADSEQPGCSRYQTRHDDDDDDDEQNQDPDQPQHSQQQPQHSCYTENSNGPEASLYHDDSSSSDHPLADTAGTGGLPEALECNESQPGLYISSSGTYASNQEPEQAQQSSPCLEEPRGSRDDQGFSRDMDTSAAPQGSGDHQPNLAELEEMMEVVIVHQFKCKMCPYKSVSKDTLINHMRDKHFKPAGKDSDDAYKRES